MTCPNRPVGRQQLYLTIRNQIGEETIPDDSIGPPTDSRMNMPRNLFSEVSSSREPDFPSEHLLSPVPIHPFSPSKTSDRQLSKGRRSESSRRSEIEISSDRVNGLVALHSHRPARSGRYWKTANYSTIDDYSTSSTPFPSDSSSPFSPPSLFSPSDPQSYSQSDQEPSERPQPVGSSSIDLELRNFRAQSLPYFSQFSHIFNGIPSTCGRILLKGEGWLLAALIAMLTGFSAAWIEVSVKFLSDLRIGVCRGMPWQDRSFCCGSRSAVDVHMNSCSVSESPVVHMDYVDHAKWIGWSALLQVRQDTVAYLVDFGMYILIGVCLAVLAAWLCQHFAQSAAGSGIPEVKAILGGFVMKGALGGWTCLIKCTGLSLAVASGLSLGKEGPLVHVACCWANLLGRMSVKYSDDESKRRELLSAASAAGVSVAFGAPLGGVLFSLEEVSSYFPPKTLWKSFFGAVVGAMFLKYLDASGTGRLTLFQMDSVSLLGTWQLVELIPFAVIGFLGGALGTLFIKLNVFWMMQKRKYPLLANHPIYEVAVVTMATCIINFPFPMLRSPSSSLLEQMFGRCGVSSDPDVLSLCSLRTDSEASYSDYSLKWSVLLELGFAAVVRFVQTVFTFGIGVPAGLFIPSLTVGALIGRVVGLSMIKLNSVFGFVTCHKCLHPGVYAIVGAAAMLGGVTRVTISIVVIMFELTGGLSYVVPFMVAVMVAKWVAEALSDKSIYDCYIRLRGYPYLDNHATHSFTVRASDIMETRLVVITLESNTVGSLQNKLDRYNFSGYPLINSRHDRMLIGFVPSIEIRKALDIARENPEVNDSTSVEFARFSMEMRNRTASTGRTLRLVHPLDISTDRNDYGGTDAFRNSRLDSLEMPEESDARSCSKRGIKIHNPVDVVDFSHIVDEQTIQVVPEIPLGQVHSIFRQLGLKLCLLTHRGRLEGLLTRQGFLQHVERLGRPNQSSNIASIFNAD